MQAIYKTTTAFHFKVGLLCNSVVCEPWSYWAESFLVAMHWQSLDSYLLPAHPSPVFSCLVPLCSACEIISYNYRNHSFLKPQISSCDWLFISAQSIQCGGNVTDTLFFHQGAVILLCFLFLLVRGPYFGHWTKVSCVQGN